MWRCSRVASRVLYRSVTATSSHVPTGTNRILSAWGDRVRYFADNTKKQKDDSTPTLGAAESAADAEHHPAFDDPGFFS